MLEKQQVLEIKPICKYIMHKLLIKLILCMLESDSNHFQADKQTSGNSAQSFKTLTYLMFAWHQTRIL